MLCGGRNLGSEVSAAPREERLCSYIETLEYVRPSISFFKIIVAGITLTMSEGSASINSNQPELFHHAPLKGDKFHTRLVQVLPKLSERNLIQCKLFHALLPSHDPSHNAAGSEREEDSPTSVNEILEYGASSNDDFDIMGVPTLLDDNGEPTDLSISYSCLSYTWGDPEDQVGITVNGKLFHVRKNLHTFLATAVAQLSNTFFWIDALCIDQENTAERNSQVQRMGTIFGGAQSVLVWLGDGFEIENTLHMLNVARRELVSGIEVPFQHAARKISKELNSDIQYEYEVLIGTSNPAPSSETGTSVDWSLKQMPDPLNNDLTGKVEKILECITEHDYWKRAWVTQEVLLARHVEILAGHTSHGFISLATKYRSNVTYFRDQAFENIVDIFLQQKKNNHRRKGPLASWGLVNLLYRFREKECAIMRDRIYSLLALCEEGSGLVVDYSLSDQELLRQVLSLRKSSLCFCSTAIVIRALGPWTFDEAGQSKDLFMEAYMYAYELKSAVCQGCHNWVPFSWTRKKGHVFCLSSNCGDLQGHLFLEHAASTKDGNEAPKGFVYAQTRENNKSHPLCAEGEGIAFEKSEWQSVSLVRFTLPSLVEFLHKDLASDLGLNACLTLWPNPSSSRVTSGAFLRFSDTA